MKLELLKQYFGHEEFRSGQETLIDCILSGRDCIGVMPTGAGKSVCYQLPAVMAEGVTLVVSPLISLMKDQVDALRENGIAAAYINSSLTLSQIDKVLQNAKDGRYKLIYIAPERLDLESFLDFAKGADFFMVTVDEAHCVSQWGQDFRPSYRKIAAFIEKLSRRPVISAFTATATAEVKQDIIKLLDLNNPQETVTGFDRENLYFEVQEPQDKYEAVIKYLNDNKEKSGIIYCSTRDNVEQVCERLISGGYSATRYHAGLTEAERVKNQDDFLYDIKTIMVATNAFGMGIDKSNVSFVIHYNMPKNIESYYQEAGRAGRDGAPADCILLYGGKDVITNQFFIENTNEKNDLPPEMLELVKQKDRERLKQMTYYCHTNDCLRRYILNYFKDESESYCGNCGNCLNNFQETDITEYAQKILSCIARMNERFGIKILIDTLRGSKSEKIKSFRLNELKTYGIMSELSEKKVREIINYLVLNGYISLTNTEFPVTRLTEKSNGVLFNAEKLYMKIADDYEKKVKPQKERKSKSEAKAEKQGYAVNKELYARLKELRMEIANAQSVPAFVIFADSALIDMCQKMPADGQEFLKVSGVGKVKLERYGERFLQVINQYEKPQAVLPDSAKMDKGELIKFIAGNFPISDGNATLSEMADKINALVLEKSASEFSNKYIRDRIKEFFIKQGLLEIVTVNGKNETVVTEKGAREGVIAEKRFGKNGAAYTQILYSKAVQKLVANNIGLIVYSE